VSHDLLLLLWSAQHNLSPLFYSTLHCVLSLLLVFPVFPAGPLLPIFFLSSFLADFIVDPSSSAHFINRLDQCYELVVRGDRCARDSLVRYFAGSSFAA